MDVLSSRILLRPTDPARSRVFYRDVLGLPVAREFGDPRDPGAVFFLGGGFLEIAGRGTPAPDGPALWLQVRDVHAEHTRLRASGVEILRPPRREPWGLVESWVADPDGVRIVLVEVPVDHPLRRDQRMGAGHRGGGGGAGDADGPGGTGGAADQGNSIQADVDRHA